jgi:serine/threonine protein phosphatase PrpC
MRKTGWPRQGRYGSRLSGMGSGKSELSSELGLALLDQIEASGWDARAMSVGPEERFSLGSSRGPIRKRNDDRVAIVQFLTPGLPNLVMMAVFDGVGSTPKGGRAASLALCAVVESIASGRGSLSALLEAAVLHADAVVYSALQESGLTTGAVVMIGPNREVVAANVGDSRVYGWDRMGGGLVQLSRDDTLLSVLRESDVELPTELLRERGLEHSLSQAIGQRRTTSDPLQVGVFTIDLRYDGLVVATDGAWSSSGRDLESVARHGHLGPSVVERLINANEWFGGRDNLSIAVYGEIASPLSPSSDRPTRRVIRVWLPDGLTTFVSVDRPAPSGSAGEPEGRRRSKKARGESGSARRDAGPQEAGEPSIAPEAVRHPEPTVNG